MYQYRKIVKGAVDDSQIQKLSIEQKIGIRESLVNDHRRPHLVYFMIGLILISDAHQRHPQNVMGFDENVRTSAAFYVI